MKTLSVTIKLEMQVPDEWDLVTTPDGIEVIQMDDGQYLDLTFEPMVAADIEDSWSNAVDDEFMNDLIGMVEAEEVTYEFQQPTAH